MTRDLLLDLGLFFYTFLYISNITYKNTLSFISAIYDLDQRSCLHCNIDEFSHTVNEFNRNLMTNMSLGNQIYDCLWQKIRKKCDTLCFLYLYISFVTVFLLNKQGVSIYTLTLTESSSISASCHFRKLLKILPNSDQGAQVSLCGVVPTGAQRQFWRSSIHI